MNSYNANYKTVLFFVFLVKMTHTPLQHSRIRRRGGKYPYIRLTKCAQSPRLHHHGSFMLTNTKNRRMAVALIFICALLALASVLGQQVDEVASRDVTFTIEHRLSSGEFVPRTKIVLVKKADGKQGLMFPEKNGIYEENGINEMKEILRSNSLYTIRLQSHFGNTSSEPILTSLPAVSLLNISIYFFNLLS